MEVQEEVDISDNQMANSTFTKWERAMIESSKLVKLRNVDLKKNMTK